MTTAFHVFHETRMVDGLQRPQAHGHRGELPEVRHQPGMRIGRHPLAIHLTTEIIHLLFADQPHEEGARIEARRGVPLKQHQVTAMICAGRMPEVIEADVIHGGRRSETGDMPTQVIIPLIGAHHHGQRIPADVAAYARLDLVIAGGGNLLIGRNAVDVFAVGAIGQVDAGAARQGDQFFDQEMGALGADTADDGFQRLQPFARFLAVGIDRQAMTRVL